MTNLDFNKKLDELRDIATDANKTLGDLLDAGRELQHLVDISGVEKSPVYWVFDGDKIIKN